MSPMPLPCFSQGDQVRIESIAPNAAFGELDALVTRRLADLGFSRGESLTLISAGVLGRGPYAVRLGNLAQFALRASEAAKILCLAERATP
ncbi:iron transporter [Lysobacteraceae bacterium NML08-0793]|nr:iron transporter [Xanthomonadaceae bacterium NML08-0793]